jgi:hypothetical protein
MQTNGPPGAVEAKAVSGSEGNTLITGFGNVLLDIPTTLVFTPINVIGPSGGSGTVIDLTGLPPTFVGTVLYFQAVVIDFASGLQALTNLLIRPICL